MENILYSSTVSNCKSKAFSYPNIFQKLGKKRQ